MKNVDEFIEKYKILEDAIARKYNLTGNASPIAYIEKRREFSNIALKLSYCREVRNFLQHEPKIKKEFAVIPSNEMISLLDELINYILDLKKCKDIAIDIKNIYYCKLDDYIIESVLNINHLKYTHIPIIENGILKGVFSKTSLFNYMISERKFSLDKNLKFKDIINYINININSSEKYLYCKYNEKVDNIKKIVENNYKNAIKVAIIFLTKNGKENEEILGMITPYDLIK